MQLVDYTKKKLYEQHCQVRSAISDLFSGQFHMQQLYRQMPR